jgi:hypothetical protein
VLSRSCVIKMAARAKDKRFIVILSAYRGLRLSCYLNALYAGQTTALGITKNPWDVPLITPHGLMFVRPNAARFDPVRMAAHDGREHSRAKYIPDAQAQHLQSTSLPFVYRSQQNGVDYARMRPGNHRCHAGDLSTLIDIAGCDDAEVGIFGNQSVKVSHHTILPNEASGPLPILEGASHHLAPVVDAGGKSGTISRQNREGCDCNEASGSVFLPNGGNDG